MASVVKTSITFRLELLHEQHLRKTSPTLSKALIDFSCAYKYLAHSAFRLCVWLDGRSHAETRQSYSDCAEA